MQRLRSTWMALMGGALLVTLSFSAAFGAAPTSDEKEANRGQTVAAFVHGLIFGDETPEDPEEQQAEEQEENEENSEDELEQSEELEELEEEQVAEEDAEESDSHGQCVSAVAHDKDGENDPEDAEYRNHGERVSEAARFTCWETDEEQDPEEEVVEEEQTDVEEDEESDSHGQCVSAVAQDKDGENDPEEAEYRNHGERVSHAARVLCRADGDEENEEEAAANEESEAEATVTSDDSDGAPKANGKANAPGQQKAKAGPRGQGAGGPGNAGRGGGNGNGRGGANGRGR